MASGCPYREARCTPVAVHSPSSKRRPVRICGDAQFGWEGYRSHCVA
jgi:hypothetical protein